LRGVFKIVKTGRISNKRFSSWDHGARFVVYLSKNEMQTRRNAYNLNVKQ
jgi:hypothetical protein